MAQGSRGSESISHFPWRYICCQPLRLLSPLNLPKKKKTKKGVWPVTCSLSLQSCTCPPSTNTRSHGKEKADTFKMQSLCTWTHTVKDISGCADSFDTLPNCFCKCNCSSSVKTQGNKLALWWQFLNGEEELASAFNTKWRSTSSSQSIPCRTTGPKCPPALNPLIQPLQKEGRREGRNYVKQALFQGTLTLCWDYVTAGISTAHWTTVLLWT